MGAKKLPTLFSLLVKGRNLYKLRTFKQRWNNEKERLNVLAEKHKRGAAARSLRAMRKAKAEKKTNKSCTNIGKKSHKLFDHAATSGTEVTGNNMQMNNVNEPPNPLRGNLKFNFSPKAILVPSIKFKTEGRFQNSRI
ncbi:zinc finger CCCH domain-containing protein 62-like isoform X1 [Olea europaea var. sylvestris]|uniref:zinc finger CCCH domain-containing protein 62-like isoform X1 n=1 Tax=Olea europaea var. sylvestris TaxID=158386 RepID=UPI000C1D0886|nr:zinc finger CCCH domain-containing protein 62-like isoform X1 [Olea europaea var. sylvestris]XP_022854878.1 zinc finger CCCH domain-containing protein 62-like isoform X1 [Olea europaea var. sylvestris]XP_022854879.1 zinc finger CCCH domain-containing protein 62-like isoform X1 [Olea europaea var. sylvestris]XP_022854880.1 zinc finger CCCH domain-containing protein 62-like isoform X1 [Olea europaea var. sylvestris]